MWFGTNCEGVWCLEDERFTRDSTDDGLSSDHVQAIAADDEGNLWFGTTRGLTSYDGETFERFAVPDGLGSNNVVCIHEAPDGTLWFATHRSELCRRTPDTAGAIRPFAVRGRTFTGTHFVTGDGAGGVWFGGGRGQLFHYADAQLTDHTQKR